MSIPTQRARFVTSYFQGSKTPAFSLLFSAAGVTSWWWPGPPPVVPPHGAPAAIVDRHTAGKQMSPFTDHGADLSPTYLQCKSDISREYVFIFKSGGIKESLDREERNLSGKFCFKKLQKYIHFKRD